ncbi:MAG TPA: hydrolase 2, exosortase A system-associated [Aquabacterium sp.]|uniref:hydrolase 2, exosortase A system-associated n=1 Tax=Aquabacterium sp. TaxID=1872578 RepID=UPI002E3526F7|nr:hydrolase 2, exosortase A system-associated [Aquabacterium sp.]HEX5354572.1 hydrolase 2, exosortase A system-associated [Aquabacterium sp.]
MSPSREVFFLGKGAGRRFCLLTRPSGRVRGTILYIPPFAEELNRSRHMVALGAQAFAKQGWTVLQMDLHGCGDSEGDFGEASWSGWLDDLDQACDWLSAQGPGPMALWSLRAGSLLASSWMQRRQMNLPLLAWQPVFNGQQYLTQFLRIRLGADLGQSPQSRNVLAELRADLKNDQAVAVGGYWLSPVLAQELEASSFKLPADHRAPVTVLEVTHGEPPELTPATSNWLEKARAAGHVCQGQACLGNKFWQSTEVEIALSLIGPSEDALKACAS